MATDDERISFLSAANPESAEVSEVPDAFAGLAHLRVSLAHPSMWDEPSLGLDDRVVATVAAAVGRDNRAAYAPDNGRDRRSVAWLRPALLGAAAAGLAAFGFVSLTSDPPAHADRILLVTGTELAPNSAGTARLTSTPSGLRIEFDVAGLPRRDGAEFYQAWLRSIDGDRLVPIGTFHDGNYVVLWAGVSFDDYPVLTVSREAVAAAVSLDQGSSGEVVAIGVVHP